MPAPRIKALLVMLTPILVIGVASAIVLLSSTRSQLDARTTAFGQSMAHQLAITVTDPILRDDLLSLNVILSELLEDDAFSSASVSSVDNRLLAQAVIEDRDIAQTFTRDIVFQDSSLGYVQIGLDAEYLAAPATGIVTTLVVVYAVVLLILVPGMVFYGDFFILWLGQNPRTPRAPDARPARHETPDTTPPDSAVAESGDTASALLVLKIRPARQFDENETTITRAISLYRGQFEVTDSGELVIEFTDGDAIFSATCCALLVAQILAGVRGRAAVNAGLNLVADRDPKVLARARKETGYLAQISEGELLTSRVVWEQHQYSDRLSMQPFHHSLVPDDQVFVIDGLTPNNQTLIERQAQQLLHNR